MYKFIYLFSFFREIQEKFRSFSQFHTAPEHEQFLRNLTKERALRLRIRELIKYRRNGLTRHEECTEYERLRYFRERKKEARLDRQRRKSVSYFPSPYCCLAVFSKRSGLVYLVLFFTKVKHFPWYQSWFNLTIAHFLSAFVISKLCAKQLEPKKTGM